MLSLSNYITEELSVDDRIPEEEAIEIPEMLSNVENIRGYMDGSMKSSEDISKVVYSCLDILKVEKPSLSDKEAWSYIMRLRK